MTEWRTHRAGPSQEEGQSFLGSDQQCWAVFLPGSLSSCSGKRIRHKAFSFHDFPPPADVPSFLMVIHLPSRESTQAIFFPCTISPSQLASIIRGCQNLYSFDWLIHCAVTILSHVASEWLMSPLSMSLSGWVIKKSTSNPLLLPSS